MRGKEKCKALKEIRQKIAQENDIEYVVSECTHKGDCKGTCPKCEAELKYLERELARREKIGKAVAVAGIAMTVCTGLTACSPIQSLIGSSANDYNGGLTAQESSVPSETDQLSGEVAIWQISSADPNDDPNNWVGGLVLEKDETEEESETSETTEESDTEETEESPELEGDIAIIEENEE